MRWNTLLALLVIIIIIISGTIIIIILGIPIPPIPGPDPICPHCGSLKWLGAAQILVSLAALYGIGKFREEIKNDLKIK
jgi:hypothetical protein